MSAPRAPAYKFYSISRQWCEATAINKLVQITCLDQQVRNQQVHQAVFLHKLVNGRGPAELCNQMEEIRYNKEHRSTEGLRSKKSLHINPKQHRTTKYEKSTIWRASKVWNSTSQALRLINDTSKFKVQVQRDITRAYNNSHQF